MSGNQNPVIRLRLSPNGATIIEFPALDTLFSIIPGNSTLVTVEESPTKETDRFIIVRPGDGFASPATTGTQAKTSHRRSDLPPDIDRCGGRPVDDVWRRRQEG